MTALRLSFVLLFLALIALPGVQMAFPLIKSTPVEENRTLAKFPALQGRDISSLTKWTAGLSPWFNDNFGFRAELIRAWNEISMRFGYSERVYLGPDHWLNYRHIIDDPIVGFARKSDKDIDHIGEGFLKLRDYLATKNVRLLIVAVPQKYQVYPESLPSSAPHIPSPTAFDKLRAYLTEHFKDDHIDAKAILMRLKAEGHQVYNKTDFHWTDWAGGEVGRAITNRIAELEGRPDLAWTAAIPDKPFAGWGGGESNSFRCFGASPKTRARPTSAGTTPSGGHSSRSPRIPRRVPATPSTIALSGARTRKAKSCCRRSPCLTTRMGYPSGAPACISISAKSTTPSCA